MRTDPPGSSGQRSSTRACPVAWRPSSARATVSHVPVLTMTPPCWKSARRDARGPLEQLYLVPRRRREQPAQVRVRGIARQRGAGLRNRGIDDRQIPLQERDGLGPQAPALYRQDAAQLVGRALEVGLHPGPSPPCRAVEGGKRRQQVVEAQRDYKDGRRQRAAPKGSSHVIR